MTIDEHIQRILATTRGRVLTVGDLARALGVSPDIVLPAIHRLVDGGLASPSFVVVHGVRTLYGLLPFPSRSSGAE